MGAATKEYFLEVLDEVVRELEELDIPHVFIGSIAMAAVLGDDWNPAEDIDILMKKDDAERSMDHFKDLGFSTHVRDPEWIYKVARPNVNIDLIFKASEKLVLDDEMIRRAQKTGFESMELFVPGSEDFAITKCLADSLENQGHWYDAIRLLHRCKDWDYLIARGAELAPKRILSALLYAQDLGVSVDDDAVSKLSQALVPG